MNKLYIIVLIILAAAAGCKKGAPEIDFSPGAKAEFRADRTSFNMVFVPSAAFKTGIDDSGTASVDKPFLIGETPVTYELWEKVYTWASEKGYIFSNPGRQGGAQGDGPVGTNQHPVTEITWRDTVVWCNALTEWFNAKTGAEYTPVYYTDPDFTRPLRQADDALEITHDIPGTQDNPYIKPDASGFRLPYSNEWELAARYISEESFSPGSFASGADDSVAASAATAEAAVFGTNTTAEVKTKKPNALGIYDMSGNVWEWCFEWNQLYGFERRIKRGGSWLDFETPQQLGFVGYYRPFNMYYYIGFRAAMTP